MAHEVRIPRLGWSMEEGTFVRWLKRAGERVAAGEALFELEGEKSVEPVESIDSGILHVPVGSPAEGAVVKVGTLVGWLLGEGEAPPAVTLPVEPAGATPPPAAGIAPSPAASPPATVGSRATGPIGGPTSPTVRRLARELRVDVAVVAGSGPGGRILADDVFAVAVAGAFRGGAATGRRPSTPRARVAAERLGIDWRSLPGSGRGGRVREADILAAAAGAAASAGATPPAAALAGLPRRRRTIAQRMLESQRVNAPVTLHCRVDMTALVSLRTRLKAAGASPVPAYTDILAKLVAGVLPRHRELAGCWDAAGGLAFPEDDGLHIGIAVDTDGGLLVPVVRDVGRRSLAEVAADSRALVAAARAGALPAAAMEGGVFTITNLGGFGIDEFTPIINLPQAAILGVGTIRREPVVTVDEFGVESVVIRDRLALSLTFDHCRVDGAPAARFLADLRMAIESGPSEPGPSTAR